MKKIYGTYFPSQEKIRLFPEGIRNLENIDEGESVLVTVQKKRTVDAHRRFFARVNEYFQNAPEKFDFEPWAGNPEFFRKHYLIKAGFFDLHRITVVDLYALEAAIQGAKAFEEYRVIEYGADDFTGAIFIDIKRARSQCFESMAQSEFLKSAEEIENCIVADFGFRLPEHVKGE